MKIRIICPGKTKQKFIEEGIAEYTKRLTAFCKLEFIETADVKLSSSNNIDIVKEKEAEIIGKYLKNDNYLIALDEKGKHFSSVDFAGFIDNYKGIRNIDFLIGGVYGLADELRQRADLLLSFSQMTFTHRMIRMLLVEQIYRSFCILNGKKYHY
jgi:23S rRNA (pseudouridine1915-N3)-methyltransferase